MLRALILSSCLFAGTAIAANPVFDVHVHLRDGETSLREYRETVREAGLELSGMGVMWFGGPHQARQGDLAKIRAGNDRVIALAELARVAAAGVKVMKIHAHTQGFDVADPRVETLVRRAGELGVAVLMDNANILPGDSEKLFNLVVRVPKTKFILAHIGGLNFRFWNILALARTADGFAMKNLYFDVSATVIVVADSPLEDEFVWTLRNVGIDQVLLGSDYPQISLASTVNALDRLPLTDEEKARIRVGNARKLFGR